MGEAQTHITVCSYKQHSESGESTPLLPEQIGSQNFKSTKHTHSRGIITETSEVGTELSSISAETLVA